MTPTYIPAIATPVTHNVTKKFTVVHTDNVIQLLAQHGLHVRDQMSVNSRHPQSARHLVRFGYGTRVEPYDEMQLIMLNAHNGTCALRFHIGVFRFVCANGLICGPSIADFRLRHQGLGPDDIIDAVESATHHFSEATEQVKLMKGATLTQSKQEELAEKALSFRLINRPTRKPRDTAQQELRVQALLTPRRPCDQGDNAWVVFNRVQENITRGFPTPYGAPYRTGLPTLRSVPRLVDLNRRLWDAAYEAAQ